MLWPKAGDPSARSSSVKDNTSHGRTPLRSANATNASTVATNAAPIDPQSDPHDAIVALLRGNQPGNLPRWSDPSELNFTPADDAAASDGATAPAHQVEPALAMPPPPLNDKIDIIPDRAPQARSHVASRASC